MEVTQGVTPKASRPRNRLQGMRAPGQLGKLAIEQAPAEVLPVAALQLQLDQTDNIRRGIIYSEILGPPVALRQGQAMWDS